MKILFIIILFFPASYAKTPQEVVDGIALYIRSINESFSNCSAPILDDCVASEMCYGSGCGMFQLKVDEAGDVVLLFERYKNCILTRSEN